MKVLRLALGGVCLFPAIAAAQTQTPQQEPGALSDLSIADDFAVSFSSGAVYSSGDYGAGETTDILVVPLSMRVRNGPLRLSATLPYLRIDSPGNVVAGGGGAPIIIDPNAPATRRTRDGFGDLSIGLAYALPMSITGAYSIDLSGRVKFPTSAQSRSLSTGKTDFAVSTDISRSIGTWAPFVTVSYRVYGDPTGVDLRNGIATSLGTTKQFGSIVGIFSYDYSRATTSAVEDAHELFAALSGPLSPWLTWTGYGIAGLSEGSPDFGLGLLLTARVN